MENLNIIVDSPSEKLLKEYADMSIAFIVDSIYKIELKDGGLNGISFTETQVEPYKKDYDTLEDNPGTLMNEFDLKNWKVVSAFDGEKRIGGAIIAFDTDGINMLEGRKDLAVLWDIRINDNYRFKGIGSQLMKTCIEWAKSKKCTRLKIETQNNNTKACKFYAGQGGQLSNINKYMYKDYPDEIQFIWSIKI